MYMCPLYSTNMEIIFYCLYWILNIWNIKQCCASYLQWIVLGLDIEGKTRSLVGLLWKTSVFIHLWPLWEKFAQIMQICWNLQAEFPPSLQITSNLPLQIYWNLLVEIPPHFAYFLKSATADLLKSAGRNSSPVCRFPQICHCRFTEICWQKFPPPPSLQISSDLPLQIYLNLLVEIPPSPWFADFLKSATADLLKSAGRNSPFPLVCRFPQICHCRFTEICWQKFPSPPSLQISSNLPLQICHQGHLHERPFTCEGNYLVKHLSKHREFQHNTENLSSTGNLGLS